MLKLFKFNYEDKINKINPDLSGFTTYKKIVKFTIDPRGLKTIVLPWIHEKPGDVAQYGLFYDIISGEADNPLIIRSITMQVA